MCIGRLRPMSFIDQPVLVPLFPTGCHIGPGLMVFKSHCNIVHSMSDRDSQSADCDSLVLDLNVAAYEARQKGEAKFS